MGPNRDSGRQPASPFSTNNGRETRRTHRPLCMSSAIRLSDRNGRKLAETGMTALERAGPGTCRSFRLNGSVGLDPHKPQAWLHSGPNTTS
jgi:hypothetical protein